MSTLNYHIESYDRVIVNGEDREFEIDTEARIIRVRNDLTPRQLVLIGLFHSHVEPAILPVPGTLLPPGMPLLDVNGDESADAA